MTTLAAHAAKKLRVSADMARFLASNGRAGRLAIGGKKTSNLFRDRNQTGVNRINIGDFNQVISIDPSAKIAEVEGMTTYEDFVAETLKFGLMPAVVPELKSITVGGAATGIGIEATSFKYGLVHETISEMDILLGDGRIVSTNADNEYSDLFHAFPNSYGTLGYALKLKVQLIAIKKFVKVTRQSFDSAEKFFDGLNAACQSARLDDKGPSFIDGVAFDKGVYYLNKGEFVDQAPWVSYYKHLNIYYKSILNKPEDYLTAQDYIWRWDTDWFWCSVHFGAQNKFVRALAGPRLLKSTTYWKIRKLANQYRLTNFLEKLNGRQESVIQDVEIPIENSAKFMDFFHKEIGIKPVWLCPIQPYSSADYSLYRMRPDKLYINFGFWDSVPSSQPDGHYNRLIEKKVMQLDGKKSLYSSSYYTEQEFWQLYNKTAYFALKTKYDPSGSLKNLYDKCVRSA